MLLSNFLKRVYYHVHSWRFRRKNVCQVQAIFPWRHWEVYVSVSDGVHTIVSWLLWVKKIYFWSLRSSSNIVFIVMIILCEKISSKRSGEKHKKIQKNLFFLRAQNTYQMSSEVRMGMFHTTGNASDVWYAIGEKKKLRTTRNVLRDT